MDRSVIERYAAGADAVVRSTSGLTPDQLDAVPVPGRWSVRQLAVHLLDSDLVGSDRMKRVAAEDRPLLIGYDENAWLHNLPLRRLKAADVAEAFRLNRTMTADLLMGLPDEAFGRVGVHSERGLLSLVDLVRDYVEHLDHHMEFMREKLERIAVR